MMNAEESGSQIDEKETQDILRFKRDSGVKANLVKRGNFGRKEENERNDKSVYV
jgi:hypothetical protein